MSSSPTPPLLPIAGHLLRVDPALKQFLVHVNQHGSYTPTGSSGLTDQAKIAKEKAGGKAGRSASPIPSAVKSIGNFIIEDLDDTTLLISNEPGVLDWVKGEVERFGDSCVYLGGREGMAGVMDDQK